MILYLSCRTSWCQMNITELCSTSKSPLGKKVLYMVILGASMVNTEANLLAQIVLILHSKEMMLHDLLNYRVEVFEIHFGTTRYHVLGNE